MDVSWTINKTESESEVAPLCPTLCDPNDCSLPASSVHGIFQAIVLEWVAISFSRGSSWPRDRTQVSLTVDRRFTIWATREVLKQDWALKNWCLWNVASEKTLESPLNSKEIKPVNPKGNKSWIFMGRTDVEAEGPIFWLLDVKRQLVEKDRDAGEDWRQKEKGSAEAEMAGWHHWLNGLEFEQTPGDSEECGSLLYCSPWGHKELDRTWWLKSNNKYVKQNKF